MAGNHGCRIERDLKIERERCRIERDLKNLGTVMPAAV
jgi:hypothetical protein